MKKYYCICFFAVSLLLLGTLVVGCRLGKPLPVASDEWDLEQFHYLQRRFQSSQWRETEIANYVSSFLEQAGFAAARSDGEYFFEYQAEQGPAAFAQQKPLAVLAWHSLEEVGVKNWRQLRKPWVLMVGVYNEAQSVATVLSLAQRVVTALPLPSPSDAVRRGLMVALLPNSLGLRDLQRDLPKILGEARIDWRQLILIDESIGSDAAATSAPQLHLSLNVSSKNPVFKEWQARLRQGGVTFHIETDTHLPKGVPTLRWQWGQWGLEANDATLEKGLALMLWGLKQSLARGQT